MTTKNYDIKVFLEGDNLFSTEDPTSIFRYYAQYRMLSTIYMAVLKPLQLQQKRRARSLMKMNLLRLGSMLSRTVALSSNKLAAKHANALFTNEGQGVSAKSSANQAFDLIMPLLLLSMAYCAIKYEEHHTLPNFAGAVCGNNSNRWRHAG